MSEGTHMRSRGRKRRWVLAEGRTDRQRRWLFKNLFKIFIFGSAGLKKRSSSFRDMIANQGAGEGERQSSSILIIETIYNSKLLLSIPPSYMSVFVCSHNDVLLM